MQMVVGILLDRFGARRLVVPAMAVCALGMLAFASASGPVSAGVGRAITGLGASFSFVGALYVVNHRFSPNHFAVLSGGVNVVGMLGTGVGVVWLSSMIEEQGWRPVMLGTAAAGGVLFVLALLFLRDGREADAIADRPTEDSPSPSLRDILSDSRIWIIAIQSTLYYVPINVFGGLWGQQAMIQAQGLSRVEAGMTVSMIFWGNAVGSVLFGMASDRVGRRLGFVVDRSEGRFGVALIIIPVCLVVSASGTASQNR